MSARSSLVLAASLSSRLSPGRRFARFLPLLEGKEVLDYGLRETELRRSEPMARWLDVADCSLKLEISHPTQTVKDRVTELLFSWFQSEKIITYAHCSAGNAGTSLVWGLMQFP